MSEYLESSITASTKPLKNQLQVEWCVSKEELSVYATVIIACDEYASLVNTAIIHSVPDLLEFGKIHKLPPSSTNATVSSSSPKSVLYGSIYAMPAYKILLISFHARTCKEEDSFKFLSSLLLEENIQDVLTIRCDVFRGRSQLWRVNTPSYVPSSEEPISSTDNKLSKMFNTLVPILPLGVLITLLPAAVTSYCDYRHISSVLLSLTIDDIDLAATGTLFQKVIDIIEQFLQSKCPVGEERKVKLISPKELKDFQQWKHTLSSSIRHLYV